MGNWYDISEADKNDDFEERVEKQREERKEKLEKLVRKEVVEIDEMDRMLSDQLTEVLSLDVIAYKIFPYFYFSNNLFVETNFLDFFGKFSCDGQGRIYQIFFFFYVKLQSDFHRFPPRDLIGMKCWSIYDTLPKDYLRKMRRVEVIQSTNEADLVLDEESVRIVSGTITNLKFCVRGASSVFKSIAECKKLRILDLYFSTAKSTDVFDPLDRLEVKCTDLRNFRVSTRFGRIPIISFERLRQLRRIDLTRILFGEENESWGSLKDLDHLKEVLLESCVFSPTHNFFSIFSSNSIEIVNFSDLKINVTFSGSLDISKQSKLKEITFVGLEDNSNTAPTKDSPVMNKIFFEQLLERCSGLKKLYIYAQTMPKKNAKFRPYIPLRQEYPQLIKFKDCEDILTQLRMERKVKVSFY